LNWFPHSLKKHSSKNKSSEQIQSVIIFCYFLCASFSVQAYELGIALGQASLFNSDIKFTKDNANWDVNKPEFEAETYLSLSFSNWIENQQRWGWETEVNIIPHNLEYSLAIDENQQHSSLKIDYYQFMFNTHYRWFPSLGPLKFEPYIGAGIGVVITEFELKQAAQSKSETLSYTGLSGQAITGLRIELIKDINLGLEYKLAYMPSDSELDDGLKLELSPWAHLFQLGLFYQF